MNSPLESLSGMEEGRNFSTLQHLLTLAYSPDDKDQQKAAMELSSLAEGSTIPTVSLGPLTHALARLLPSTNRSIVMYAARALKRLILDDALRSHAIAGGIVSVVCDTLKQWEDEIICVRELLAALQTLCWDKSSVKLVTSQGILHALVEYLQASDAEVQTTAFATLANILSYSDTVLIAEEVSIHFLAANMHILIESLCKTSHNNTCQCYIAAAVANASANPVLAGALLQAKALEIMREIEGRSLSLGGSKLLECAQTSIYRLSQKKEGNPKHGMKKYQFKWGMKAVMELSLADFPNKMSIGCCFVIWLMMLVFVFYPIIIS